MATFTGPQQYKGDEDQDEIPYSPDEFERGMGDIEDYLSDPENQQAARDQIEAGQGAQDAENYANDPENATNPEASQGDGGDLGDQEEELPRFDKDEIPTELADYEKLAAAGKLRTDSSSGQRNVGRIRGLLRKRKALVLTGTAFTSITGIAMVGILSLTGLKIDISLDSIERESFVKFNSLFDRRSQKWFESYVKMRLVEIDGGIDGDTAYFRADRYDGGRDNYIRDWYRTMRTGSFEQELFQQTGIAFTAFVDRDGNVGTAKITIRGETALEILPDDLFREREVPGLLGNFLRGSWTEMDPEVLTQIMGDFEDIIDVEFFTNDDKRARAAIADAVGLVPDNNILKRRNVRKAIGNITGTRAWRAFEGTRKTIDEAKNDFRKYVLNKVLPANKTGEAIRCILAVTPCPDTSDASNPDNNVADVDGEVSTFDGEQVEDETPDGQPADVDSDGNAIDPDPDDIATSERSGAELNNSEEALDGVNDDFRNRFEIREGDTFTIKSLKRIMANRLIAKFNFATGIVDFFDTISHIHKNIAKFALLAKNSKAAQLIAWSTAAIIANDQIAYGEGVHSTEVDGYDSTFEGFENSEGYETIIAGNTGLTATRPGGVYAANITPEKREQSCRNPVDRGLAKSATGVAFWFFCDEDKPAGVAKFGETYQNSTVGSIFGGITAAWDGVGILASPFRWVSNITGVIGSAVSDAVLSALGLDDDVDALMEALTGELLELVGVVPLDPTVPGGVNFNRILAGSAHSAEKSLRFAGGYAGDAADVERSRRIIYEYELKQEEDLSLFDRYASLDNPNSLASSLVLAAPTRSELSNPVRAVASIFSKGKNAFLNVFGLGAIAQDDTRPSQRAPGDDQALREFAGLEEDEYITFPEHLIDVDPAEMELDATLSPVGCTNVREIIPEFDLTWEIARNQEVFWATVHEQLPAIVGDGDYDAAAYSIYNMCIAEEWIANAIQCPYSPYNDCGINDGETGSAIEGDRVLEFPTGNAQSLARQVLDHPNISLRPNTPLTLQALENTAEGLPAPVEQSRCSAPHSSYALSPTLLRMLIALGDQMRVEIGFLTNGCHSSTSDHYYGAGVDIRTVTGNTREQMQFLFNNRQELGVTKMFHDPIPELNLTLSSSTGEGTPCNCAIGGHPSHLHVSVRR